jgi:aldose 1-epimerase
VEADENDRKQIGTTLLGPTCAQFGTNPKGEPVSLFTLSNKTGMKAQITNFGGKVVSILVPDRNGLMADVVLGYSTYPEWESGNPYFGAIIGRYANRIANGRFSINGVAYRLELNNGPNALHGGPKYGFHNVLWRAKEICMDDAMGIELSHTSPDGEEGFPGNLNVSVIYLLNDKNELIIRYSAKTDLPTPVNMTHHSFFNLHGAGNGDILGHSLMINAEMFTPVDSTLIPTGEILSVIGTPFDFTLFRSIGERINNNDSQIKYGNGYDHNFVLKKNNNLGNKLQLAATVLEPESGRRMEVFTTEPGLQFYSGNFLDGSDVGREGLRYQFRSAFCLETQHFPDSPNKNKFPNTILQPGIDYRSDTIYRFSVY